MVKTKGKKFHKIKIHHNRWLIWAIAYLLFVSIAMLGYLKVANLNIESEAENSFTPSRSYSDSRLGFALRYPATWAIEARNSSVAFLPSESSDEGVTVSTAPLSSEKLIRQSLTIKSEKAILIDNHSASQLTNDLGQGHSEIVVIIPREKLLYVVRGSSVYVEKLLPTIYFPKK